MICQRQSHTSSANLALPLPKSNGNVSVSYAPPDDKRGCYNRSITTGGETMGTPKTFRDQIRDWTAFNLDNCIGVDECMKACPVVDPAVTIADLNEASRPEAPVPDDILKFTRDCVQCGRCDTVCPTAAGRSVMMLALKKKMADDGRSPGAHARYFALKGYDKSPLRRSAFTAFTKTAWRLSSVDREKSRLLAPHIDKPTLRKAEHLIYVGCYVFTKERSAAQTVAIAEKAGLDYETLAGLSTCCGWPSLLAGRTDEAERYHAALAERVAAVDPAYVVSGCAECYSSLRLIKEKYAMPFEPLTTPQWIERFADRLDLRRDRSRVTFHDSCHVTRKAGLPQPARDLLARMVELTEMPRSGPRDTWCCGYWGLDADPAILRAVHESRFDEAKETGAPTMIVECVSCLESFAKHREQAGVAIRDIVDLVYERMGGETP